MKAIDFKYNNKKLSDINFIIGSIDANGGQENIDTGSLITFNTIANSYGKSYSLANTQYNSCIGASFDICKNPDNNDDLAITEKEYRAIMRWLNRKEFLPFNFINYDNENENENVYFNASFNISKIYYNHAVYAIRCNMVTNAPYGYGKKRRYTYSANGSNTFTITDPSDEIGYIYPDMVITCREAGDLLIKNTSTNTTMQIKNVSNNEVINIKGQPQIITTSKSSHDIANDFNYSFITVGNTEESRKNILSANLSCNIVITYTPIIKNIY